MKMDRGKRLAVVIVILVLGASTLCAGGAVDWQIGRVTAIEISGTGYSAQAATRVKKDDLWWTYSICTAGRTYFAASRVAPARIGLEIGSTLKFSATSSLITILDAGGKRYSMRILRLDKSQGCTSR